jgi:HEAT repeat protein
LRKRATKEVFLLAKGNLTSKDPLARARALDILAQLGAGKRDSERPYMKPSVSFAIKAMDDKNATVAHSAAWALAHLRTPKAVGRLIKAKNDRDVRVRHAVAFGLGGPSTNRAVQTLIGLMEDKDKEIRDWATFSMSLGWPTVVDSPLVRAALRKRLKDRCRGARSEAIWGLARRKDKEGLQLLLSRLEGNARSWGDEMAASEALNLSGKVPIKKLRAKLRGLLAEAG